jgi:putative tricarboxylic transport membrane protein
MSLAHRITGLVLLPIAAFLGYHAWRMSYYTAIGPGPGFFPRWLCGFLAALGLALLIRPPQSETEGLPPGFLPDRTGLVRIVVAIGSLFAVSAAMRLLGFSLTMLAFYVVMLTALGRRRPLEIAVRAFAGSFGVDYVFSQILRQPLPAGILGS